LRRELNTALAAVKARNANTFLLKTKDGTEAIPFHRIVYCELEGRTLCCVTADGEKRRSVTVRTPFDEAVSGLIADERFIRPHTSFAVNMDYIKSMHRDSLIMKTGEKLPITNRALSGIKETYLQYFFGSNRG
ncbi:MAG: LytTR family transcriptional regulator, partial [Spirochaetaceae bacterium]|nr:LytTR family transcriptional regulator [Spirochaetaceae bacterium]